MAVVVIRSDATQMVRGFVRQPRPDSPGGQPARNLFADAIGSTGDQSDLVFSNMDDSNLFSFVGLGEALRTARACL